MKKNKILIGMVGAGQQARDNLLSCISAIEGTRLFAVCDANKDSAGYAADVFGAESYFTDYKEMLSQDEVNAVIMACPPQVHTEVASFAMDKGVHVFVEKPPTVTTKELIALDDLSKRKGVVNAVELNFRYAEPLKMISKILKSDAFGDLIYICVKHIANKPKDHFFGVRLIFPVYTLLSITTLVLP